MCAWRINVIWSKERQKAKHRRNGSRDTECLQDPGNERVYKSKQDGGAEIEESPKSVE